MARHSSGSHRARSAHFAWTLVIVCGTGRQQATSEDWRVASMAQTQRQNAPQEGYEAAWADMFASLQTAYADLTRAQFELERRTAEIEAGRDLFLEVIESMSEAWLLMDRVGRVQRVNPAAAALLECEE